MPSLTGSLRKDVPLRVQPKAPVIEHISALILRLAMLYSIPNYSAGQSIVLAEWVVEKYNCDLLDTIIKALTDPPIIPGEKTWRLNPDTISAWMAIEIDKLAEQRESKWQNIKNKEADRSESSPVTDEFLQNLFKDSWIQKYRDGELSKEEGYKAFKKAYEEAQQAKKEEKAYDSAIDK